MTTATKGAPKRGPGRPPRADGLRADSEEARALSGMGRLNLRVPDSFLEMLDEMARHKGRSRGAVIGELLMLGFEQGWCPDYARKILRRAL